MNPSEIRKTLESTLLAPTASGAGIEKLCAEAMALGLYGVCVAPCRVREALGFLKGSEARVVSVAGFPLGNSTAETKAGEVAELVQIGAHEVDIVANAGLFLEGRVKEVAAELKMARKASEGRVLKVILETGFLTPAQIGELGGIALSEGADFLKTSTGYGPRGATVEDIRILAEIEGPRRGIKASGGIRTLSQVEELIAAGATRIGTSSAGAIMGEALHE
ncbi:deoxyribose-phosphate aldolase [bacterium]|nr:MAG: deoxyribose-phosphate aldolase [bacterium]